MTKNFTSIPLFAVIALTTVLATPASATLQVIINGTNAGGTVTGGTLFTDNAAGDLNPAAGILSFSFGAANFTIQGSTSTSGSPVASISMTTTGQPVIAPSTLTIAVSDNGFTIPPVPLFLTQSVSGTTAATGGVGATFTAVGYFGANNTNFNTGGPSTGTAASTVNGAAGITTSGTINSGNPYSLTEFITVNITSLATGTNKNLQVNADLNATAAPVPEPSSVVLLSSMLGGAFMMFRKKFQNKKG